MTWPDGGPNMILDDGGDATMLVHKGREYELAGAVPDPSTGESEEFQVFLTLLQASVAADAHKWTTIADGIKGAKFVVMDNCGHWPQFEDADTFNRIQMDFLAS